MKLQLRVGIGMVFIFYALLTLPFALWPSRDVGLTLFVFGLYSLLAIGLSTELTELLLALWCPPRSISARNGQPSRSKAAVLMTICDDWSLYRIKRLMGLAHAGYDVYLLDDSKVTPNLPAETSSFLTHVFRKSQKGAKAGNLNNWIHRFGHGYELVFILDADSYLSPRVADIMVLSAEHPENNDVAVFQSKIEPDLRHTSLFAKALSAGARPRARVLERVHGSLGLLLSFGHNQLVRLNSVYDVGGFNESCSAEDTALSFTLAGLGWRIELVDVWSQDTDPYDVVTYNRRTTRWAQQTVEMFRYGWHDVPLRLKLLLCRHLIAYVLPIIGIALLMISLWAGPRGVNDTLLFLVSCITFKSGFQLYGTAIVMSSGIYLSVFILRIVLARLEQVPWKTLGLSILLGSSAHLLLIVPLTIAMIRTALGQKVRFIPTNSKIGRHVQRSTLYRVGLMASVAPIIIILISGMIFHPGSLFVGFNLLWIGALLISPIGLLLGNIIYNRSISKDPICLADREGS